MLLGKLLKLWAVSKTVSSTTPLFMRLLMGMAAITFFAIFAAVVTAILMMGIVWFSYTQLLAQGIEPTIAMLIIAVALLIIIGVALSILQRYWVKVQLVIKSLLYMQAPIPGKFTKFADAFMDGFNSPSISK